MRPPSPQLQWLVGHLGRWGTDPLALLEEGAALGPVFRLRLWRQAFVGYSPEWNRFILGDLATFRSKGSLSGLSPHLAAGLVHTDAPAHRDRRSQLNPVFARKTMLPARSVISEVVLEHLPRGQFDAITWSAGLIRAVLSATFFGGVLPAALLGAFLKPLDAPLPLPFVPRPGLFRRMNRAIEQAMHAAPAGTLAAALRDLPGGVAETRVALSAGYDTTAHTLAWLLYHTARAPKLRTGEMLDLAINEVLRLYPAGWVGTRRCASDVTFDSVRIPRGALVMYSPYLTHRDPALWSAPRAFRPERFRRPLPPWGYIPFAAGERSCLGRSFALLVLRTVVECLADYELRPCGGNAQPKAGITLVPAGPLPLLLRR
jgi:cytochrome P450